MADDPASRTAATARKLPLAEFVTMTALLMALNALAIDIMLPALPAMGETFSVATENQRQLIVVVYMLGFGVSQLFFGPLSDRFGRRPILFVTIVLYALTGMACIWAPDFGVLLAARALQGGAAGGVRVAAAAIARDLYSGRLMAKVMSLVMIVFMAAPIIAPSLGQAVLLFSDWRGIFWALVIFAAIMLVWTWFRLPETLSPDARQGLQPATIARNYWKVLTTREALGYTIASGFLFSSLLSFVSSSEQLYHEVYHTGTAFPLWFAGAAGVMAVSNLVNSWLVERLGMRRISHIALVGFVAISAIHAALAMQGPVPFPLFYLLVCAAFFMIGFQGPNFNAIAMEPLGQLAGSGSAVIGFASSFGAAALGGYIASHFNGTTTPIFVGHVIVSSLALVVIFITEKGRLFHAGKAI